ncbi:S1C family serine protease [Natronorarus salvus]|uniref:S1C family serine protease n=1 Tax=Natronorarus salvus TaxID=3117733 RepID=UPI002F269351
MNDQHDTHGSGYTKSVRRREILQLVAAAGVLAGTGCVDAVTGIIDAGGARNVDDARAAVIRITTEGTYAEHGDDVMLGAGSGFIVDPSGIAITNNHNVAGAVTLRVFVGSEQTQYDATVLGVSECADLAVIDIQGDGFQHLRWYDGDLETGDEVWALGFPGGDPSYTTTHGTITGFESAPTSWASVDSVIEHTAQLEGGNSGGPLVDKDGRVVGINYSAIDPIDAFSHTQNFAIDVLVARDIVDRLREGEDVQTLGINGFAVPADGSDPAGIWVSATTSGSPASDAGIRPGDIITAIERLPMAGQGTMEEYCNVLRTRSSNDVLAVSVYREGVVLEGEINGRELEPAEVTIGEPEVDDAYEEYVVITDDTGAIQVAVPSEWSEVDGRSTEFGPRLLAAPDLDQFTDTYGGPGLAIWLEDASADPGAVLDSLTHTACTINEPVEYADPLYTGVARELTTCGEAQSTMVHIAARPADGSYVIVVEVQLVEARDLDALNHIADTFQVVEV